ncbi:MAG TPA: hypothetical protein VER12_05700 [Polyangiaceae bacterium]|nr:hypothetical protein [Polyangiaceae bacterium]
MHGSIKYPDQSFWLEDSGKILEIARYTVAAVTRTTEFDWRGNFIIETAYDRAAEAA